ncbi:competence protein ComEA [Agromyces sp. 3263]|uniref:ComEA family DNA-binding protein n=1 Tax=Agromyces sp. 3263 TaxID=2817750 RepID=UPI0028565E88|nr:ComEA family DNA-binding protein [Agromyces sp. 3263]MDR6907071.1 competence protein ComEA [Agromyces sp. 3263]
MPASRDHPFDALDPAARRATPRARVAIGAAVVLFIAAVAAAALMSFVASGGGMQERVVATGGPGAGDGSGPASGSASGSARASTAVGVETTPVLVHVLGAVVRPGLVELHPGDRVVDAVAAAGGFTPDADPAGVNLARPVADGEQLVVFAVGQVPPPSAPGGTGAASATGGGPADGLVHLNTADVAALDTLPRIGPALAQRIIDWRAANGPFTSVDQLLDVAGIGDAVFSGLADKVAL